MYIQQHTGASERFGYMHIIIIMQVLIIKSLVNHNVIIAFQGKPTPP